LVAFTHSRHWDQGLIIIDLFKSYLRNNGWEVIELKEDDPNNVPKLKYDLCFGWGLSDTLKYVRDELNTKAIVFDLGMIRRTEIATRLGYFRCGIYDEKWVCPELCDSIRWQYLNIPISEKRSNPNSTIAFMGQVPNDVSHGMGEDELLKWTYDVIQKCKKDFPCDITYRPHPLTTFREKQKGFCNLLAREGLSIDLRDERIENLPIEEFRCVITYCSTSALHFIINGIPVLSSKNALYSELTSHLEDEKWDVDYLPSASKRLEWLSKISYSQWNQKEIADGTMFQFIRKYLNL